MHLSFDIIKALKKVDTKLQHLETPAPAGASALNAALEGLVSRISPTQTVHTFAGIRQYLGNLHQF